MTDKSDQLWLIPTAGHGRTAQIADVALRLRTNRLYSFAVPELLAAELRVGSFVRVPHGRGARLIEGWVVRVSSRELKTTTRAVDSIIAGQAILDERLVGLALWVAEYYVCPPGLVLDAIVPARLREARCKRVSYVELAAPEAGGSNERAQALLARLANGPVRRAELLADAQIRPGTLRSLLKRGAVRLIVRSEPVAPADNERPAEPPAVDITPEDSFALSDAQRDALASVARFIAPTPAFHVALLFGIPGSGKTEVYVRAIRQAVAGGRQAILLIPEIALATQMVQRLAARFGRVAVVHSRLPGSQRMRVLRDIAAGDVDVVIGTRTAVFAPCRRLGLIVVDEEQEGSFKSIAAPYYHARDVAIKRGQMESFPVLLGSATPALETWHNAHSLPHMTLLSLPTRVGGACTPSARRIDTSRRALGQTTSVLAPQLVDALRETLRAGRQAILLHNRRGYAVHLRCSACGLLVRCQRCGAAMSLHRADGRVKCHRCGRAEPAPDVCLDGSCAGPLESVGSGIQRLEEELRRELPGVRLVRLDSDTMIHRGDYAAALGAFEHREADVLVGTQMVAKGLDFPSVALVGVLEADAALALPDFRAAERVFQLLMQVVGRAGRGDGSSVALLQSATDPGGIIRDAMAMDYESFAARELELRRELGDPPYSRLARVVLSDERPGAARRAAQSVADGLRSLAGRIHAAIVVDDPQPCIIQRTRGRARFEVRVRLPREIPAHRLLLHADRERLLRPSVRRVTVDVDPIDLF